MHTEMLLLSRHTIRTSCGHLHQLCAHFLMSLLLQFGKAKPGTQQVKKAQAPVRKNFPAPKGTRSTKKYGKNEQQDQLWLPNTERPGWLDGSMPGLHYHIL